MPESQGDIHADFRRTQKWRDKLHKSICHKSLDIPEDDVNINQHGITGKHLCWIAGIVLLGVLGWRVIGSQPELNGALPTAQEYEVSFWAKDGTEYEVQPMGGVE